MPRTNPVSRRAVLSALVGFAAAPLAACSTPDIPGAPSITPPTPTPAAPGAVAGGTAGASSAVAAVPAAPVAPVASSVAPVAVLAPTPTLLPPSTSVSATLAALSSTSASLSATATTEARATLGSFGATSTGLTASGGTPAISTPPFAAPAPGIATANTPGSLATIPVVAAPASVTTTVTTTTTTTTTATATALPTAAAISTAVPTVAPAPVMSTVAPAVQMTVNAARARFDRVNTLHFTLAVDGFVYLDDARSQRLTAADGDLVRPDRVSLAARVAIGSIVAQVRFVQVAEAAFLTNILTGRWQTAPSGFSYDPRIVFDANRGVSAVMGGVQSWTFVENVRIGATDTQHLRGVVAAAIAAPLVSNSLRGDTVDIAIYVEGRNSDVLKLVLAEQPAAIPDGSPVSKWTLDLSRQNDNITIAAPVIGATPTR